VRGVEDLLFDTSAAVPFLLEDHPSRDVVVDATRNLRRGLAGHAWFETYSVLTRLPGQRRRSGRVVSQLLADAFPATRFLDATDATSLVAELPRLGIAGGAVYDALVGAVARAAGLVLVTRNRRAKAVYDALGVQVMLVD
jgi:predicted nucleic acid-binding protein